MKSITIQRLLQMYKPGWRDVEMTFLSREDELNGEPHDSVEWALDYAGEPDNFKFKCAILFGDLNKPESIYFFRQLTESEPVALVYRREHP